MTLYLDIYHECGILGALSNTSWALDDDFALATDASAHFKISSQNISDNMDSDATIVPRGKEKKRVESTSVSHSLWQLAVLSVRAPLLGLLRATATYLSPNETRGLL